MKTFAAAIALVALLPAAPALAQAEATQSAPAQPDWVETSNAYTQKLIDFEAQFYPEGASSSGYDQYDGQTFDYSLDADERYVVGAKALKAEFTAAMAQESNPFVKQDLAILIDSLDRSIASSELSDRYMLEWNELPQSIFYSIGAILSDQTAEDRRASAVDLLRKYTGVEDGYEPYTEQAKAHFEASRGPNGGGGKIGPYAVEVEESIGKIPTFVAGIRELFEKYDIDGADEALDAMETQYTDYGEWTRETVLPEARDTARLPEELYALNLRNVGIDMDPREAMSQARRGFYEIRAQMEALAPQIAQKLSFVCGRYQPRRHQPPA